MGHIVDVGWPPKHCGVRVNWGIGEKIPIRFQGSPNLVHQFHEWKSSIGGV